MTSKLKILNAALHLVRTRGFSATTVDDLCAEAGVSKGAFFHHFESKEALGVETVQHWSRVTEPFFATAPYHQAKTPRDRVLSYLRFRREIIQGEVEAFTCVAGTMLQEIHQSSTAIREACGKSILDHAETLVADIRAAKEWFAPEARWEPRSLAVYTQTVLQGAFIVAKTQPNPDFAIQLAQDQVDHLIRYVEFLLPKPKKEKS